LNSHLNYKSAFSVFSHISKGKSVRNGQTKSRDGVQNTLWLSTCGFRLWTRGSEEWGEEPKM